MYIYTVEYEFRISALVCCVCIDENMELIYSSCINNKKTSDANEQ